MTRSGIGRRFGKKRDIGAPDARIPKFLGWFSVGIGMAEILFPETLARLSGFPARPKLTRLMGMREIAVGIGILTARNPGPWIQARVAGDAIDLALLGAAFGSRESNPGRLTSTVAMAAAATAADVMYARKISAASRIPVEAP